MSRLNQIVKRVLLESVDSLDETERLSPLHYLLSGVASGKPQTPQQVLDFVKREASSVEKNSVKRQGPPPAELSDRERGLYQKNLEESDSAVAAYSSLLDFVEKAMSLDSDPRDLLQQCRSAAGEWARSVKQISGGQLTVQGVYRFYSEAAGRLQSIVDGKGGPSVFEEILPGERETSRSEEASGAAEEDRPWSIIMGDKGMMRETATQEVSSLLTQANRERDKDKKAGLSGAADLIAKAISGDYSAEEQIELAEDVKNAWKSYSSRFGFSEDAKKFLSFLDGALAMLRAGKPLFPFLSTPFEQGQDPAWQKYLAGSSERQRVWKAWSANRKAFNLAEPANLAFKSFDMWWKDASRRSRFSDGRKGSINATVQLLRKEARLPPESGT